MTQMNLSTKQKRSHRRREETYSCQREEERERDGEGEGWRGRGMDWEFGVGRCKLLHLEWINSKVLLYSTGNYTQYLVINYNGKEYKKRMSICV